MNLDKHLTRSRNNTTWCYLQNIENFPFPFSNMGTEEDAAGNGYQEEPCALVLNASETI